MRFTSFKNKNLLILSFALGLLFFGFNGAEQHLTPFYDSIGKVNVAFIALAILYSAIAVGNFLGPPIVNRIGIKSCLILGFLTYVLFIFGVIIKSELLIYVLSAVLGIGAGIIGIARIDFLRIIAPIKNRGEYAGLIETIRTFGGFLGLLSISLLLLFFLIDQVFVLLGTVMILGTLLLFFLQNIKDEENFKATAFNFGPIIKFFKDPRVLLLIPHSAAGGLLLGLVLASVPLSIKENYGIEWIGVVTSVFHLTLAAFLFLGGYFSDIKGRFPVIYLSIAFSVAGALFFLLFKSLPMFFLIMFLFGLGRSVGVASFTALVIDVFEKESKEAKAVINNLGLVLGVVPAFILPIYLGQKEIFYILILLTLTGGVLLFIFQKKFALKTSS